MRWTGPRLFALLAAIMSLVIVLLGSVIYDSHRQTALRQEITHIAVANASTARSLPWLNQGTARTETLLDLLLTLGSEDYLYLLLGPDGMLYNPGSNSIWAGSDSREQLFRAIRDGGPGGNLFIDEMKFTWARAPIPDSPYTLVSLHQEHDTLLRDFLAGFGLPLLIMAGVILWILFWVSLIAGSLFKKLNAQNLQLEEQATALAEARDDALKASQAKGTFLANMSHEIRTPLTAVIGYSELLLSSDQGREERLEAINTIHKSSQHVLQIINQILDLSKIEANHFEVERVMVSPIKLLCDVAALMRIQAREKGLDFGVRNLTPMPKTVLTDPTRLKQILLNLFSNAVKFTAQGAVQIEVGCMPEKQRLWFSVIDTGIGMSAEQVTRVFEAFTQADVSTTRQYGGTGLGLTLSRQFAELLGGGITLSSEPGVGSRFTVEIATGNLDNVAFVAEIDKLRKAPDSLPGQLHRHYRGEVLLAEDTEENQRLLAVYLRKLGASVTLADNGQQAIDAALAQPFDLILMDVQMPVVNGLDATRRLRAHGYTRPIVALTANIASDYRQQCSDAGCDGYLAKPVDRALFSQVVASYLVESDVPGDTRPVVSQLLREDPGLADIIAEYIGKLPHTLQRLRAASEQPAWDELRTLLHQLKGTGGNYGFAGLSELAAKLEFQVMNNNRAEVAGLLAELDAYCARIQAGHLATS